MKTPLCVSFLFLAFPLFAAPDGAKILEHTGRDGVIYEWYLTPQQFRDAPCWDPYKGDPPLSISNAVAIASKWIKNRWPSVSSDRFRLRSIKIDGGPRVDSGPLTNFFYYIVIFRVGDFDSRTCILLMDGSVLEPKAAGMFEGEAKPERRAPVLRSKDE